MTSSDAHFAVVANRGTLAQCVKRIGYEDVNKFASPCITYGGRTEADVMWSAICDLQRQLADAGFAPR